MQTKHLHTYLFAGGLGLLAACPTAGDDTDATTAPSDTAGSTDGTTDPTIDPTTTGSSGDTSGTTEPLPPPALCDRLGGTSGVSDLINAVAFALVTDEKINGYFLNSDIDAGALIVCLNKQLGELAACPGVIYDCKDMKSTHAGLGISANDFMDHFIDFSGALDVHQQAHPGLTDEDKATILAALGSMAPDIVEDSNNDLTVYQRIGRKPAIKALIGRPGEATSFVDNVANDAAINGFFGGTDFERLNTCLTRQVSSVDGPTRYGLEIDAPLGLEPGAGLGNPCKDMATAHMGLVDADDMTGIDINDFGALVADLVAAMDSFGVAQADQDALLGVLGPMCEDIVAPEFKEQCPNP